MSERWPGGFITKSPVVPNGETASGVWTLDQAEYYTQQNLWPLPNTYWMATLGSGGTNQDSGNAVAVDSGGNVYVVGAQGATTSGFIVKYNADGALVWQRSITGGTYFYANAVAVGPSGDIYVAGSWGTGGSVYAVVLKYDPSGNLLWQKRYGDGGGYSFSADAMVVDSAEQIFVGGSSTISYSNYAYYIALSSSGSLLTQRETNVYNNAIQAIAVDSSGSVYLGGRWNTGGSYPAILIKWNSLGTIVWSKQFSPGGGGTVGMVWGIVVSDGRVYTVGQVPTAGGGQGVLFGDFSASNGDSSGSFNTLGLNSSSTWGRAPVLSSDGNMYITGSYGTNLLIAKCTLGGTPLWQTSVSTNATSIRGVGLALRRNIPHVTGYIQTNGLDVFSMKVKSNGTSSGTYSVGGSTVTLTSSSLGSSSYSMSPTNMGLSSGSPSRTFADATLTSATSTLTSSVTII